MQLLGVVVDAIVDAAVYSVADTKVTERSGSTINDNRYGDKNDYGNGVQKRENAWMCY